MMHPSETPQEYYARPGRMTDPGEEIGQLDGLPAEIGRLCEIVQGVLLHIFWAERYGESLSETRQAEVQQRGVREKLARIRELDARPLIAERPPALRVVGNCRDFSVLLCTILRHQGVPARARCGFGAYFMPNHYEDHWVCEYWRAGEGRWVLVDAQMDALQRGVLSLPFDPLDVPREQFITAGRAWQMCRAGQADPDLFGIFEWHGWEFVRGNVLRDFAALNKEETLPWDYWGVLKEDETSAGRPWVDELARLCEAGDAAWAELRARYAGDERVRWPVE